MPKTVTPEYFASVQCAEIETALRHAQACIWSQDRTLLIHDAHERSICGRLAFYLVQEFPQFDVDLEYNRDHADEDYRKRISGAEWVRLIAARPRDGHEDGLMVLPDIIVHIRDHPLNLLVIEAKKSSSAIPRDRDLAKLGALKAELHYRFAYFIEFPIGHSADATGTADWFFRV